MKLFLEGLSPAPPPRGQSPTRGPLPRASLRSALAVALLALTGCTFQGVPSDTSALCTCSSDQKYDDASKSCVAAADFTPEQDCQDDGQPVCGCDGKGYTSSCKAFAVGVEVQYAGACNAANGGGFGGFGW